MDRLEQDDQEIRELYGNILAPPDFLAGKEDEEDEEEDTLDDDNLNVMQIFDRVQKKTRREARIRYADCKSTRNNADITENKGMLDYMQITVTEKIDSAKREQVLRQKPVQICMSYFAPITESGTRFESRTPVIPKGLVAELCHNGGISCLIDEDVIIDDNGVKLLILDVLIRRFDKDYGIVGVIVLLPHASGSDEYATTSFDRSIVSDRVGELKLKASKKHLTLPHVVVNFYIETKLITIDIEANAIPFY